MIFSNETDLDIEHYCRTLAKWTGHIKLGLVVEVAYREDIVSFKGYACANKIRIYVNKDCIIPRELYDHYIANCKRLAEILSPPKVAIRMEELIGYIFLHEFCHHLQYKYRLISNEEQCTEFAWRKWYSYHKVKVPKIRIAMKRTLKLIRNVNIVAKAINIVMSRMKRCLCQEKDDNSCRRFS